MQNRSIPIEKEDWPSAGAQREVLACFQEAVRVTVILYAKWNLTLGKSTIRSPDP